jgi:exosortase E/protease (VPEID-CTERM system)
LLAAVLAADCVTVAYVPHSAALIGPLAPFGIAAFAVFLGLGYSTLKADREPLPFGRVAFLLHLGCIAAVWFGNVEGYTQPIYMLASRCALILGIALLAQACIPFPKWIRLIRQTSPLWLYATIAGALAWCLRYPFQSFWNSSQSEPGRVLALLAFHSVRFLLRPFLPDVIVDPNTFVIGTSRFAVRIAEACSGLEGLGLVLVFTTVWLWYFRRENRFPHALLLIPCALIFVWMLNIVRIAALILIGNAGAGEVAMVGFHSQAGWIAFTAVALGFSMATRKIAWVQRSPVRRAPTQRMTANLSHDLNGIEVPAFPDDSADSAESGESSATRAYLVPFLAILAASFISKAASGHFEWLYPLRFVAAAVALWFCRAELKKLNWRFGWLSLTAGFVVFAVWVAPTLFVAKAGSSTLGAALNGLTPAARYTWIFFRIAAAVITVPIAEELAFRGYLARRLMFREFETVPFTSLSYLAIALSSVAFGLMHGQQWMVGIFAGLIYVGIVKRTGRIGDAVAAHSVSNLLLAVWVLARGDWFLW